MNSKGFTLIELMIVVVVVAIMAAIAVPTYNSYNRKAYASQSMQEIQKLAEQLEKHKARNFSYKNFNPVFLYRDNSGVSSSYSGTNARVSIPLNATDSGITYRLYIRDLESPNLQLTHADARGKNWVILAEANNLKNNGTGCKTCNSLQQQNYSYLLTSTGIQCKTLLALNAVNTLKSDTLKSNNPCGVKGEDW
jgi:type IV pilus assembly protein PilE